MQKCRKQVSLCMCAGGRVLSFSMVEQLRMKIKMLILDMLNCILLLEMTNRVIEYKMINSKHLGYNWQKDVYIWDCGHIYDIYSHGT